MQTVRRYSRDSSAHYGRVQEAVREAVLGPTQTKRPAEYTETSVPSTRLEGPGLKWEFVLFQSLFHFSASPDLLLCMAAEAQASVRVPLQAADPSPCTESLKLTWRLFNCFNHTTDWT